MSEATFEEATEYVKGYLTFVISILGIGILTAFIGDLASHFGCTIGLKDSITAIAFVALGTSVPGTLWLLRSASCVALF
ncbi:Sodium/calcium exchanger 1 [Portunus trituberculatus]|uniref:Sodium/calcium exchanger 1 n=1 Tax=Portunus trituberculatus TaxID=210409 RepID=A0A5B7D5S5_PORTR|nr:Sodium/calcium exchanger 1 [Portunus trituberculatus]